MTQSRRFPSWPWRAHVRGERPPTQAPAAVGEWEADLDIRQGHFGPTQWCRSWAEWLQHLQLDSAAHAFVVADHGGERRVVEVLDAASLRTPPLTEGSFPCVKYYRSVHGWSVAVSFALEALTTAAD